MKFIKQGWLGLALMIAASTAFAQAQQFIPILSYRVGPYAAGGSGYFGGVIDYFKLLVKQILPSSRKRAKSFQRLSM